MRRPTSPNLCTFFVALLLFAAWVRPFADLDFTWQVRTGEQILSERTLHVEDRLSYTIAGKHLPDFEWLYEVILHLVWSVTGWAGLHFLKVLCVLTPLLLMARRQHREGVGRHAIALSLVVAVLALIPTWNLRPFCCTTCGLLLLSGLLRDHCLGRRPLSWQVPLLMLFWGNLHPGVITGQGLLAGAIAWEWLNRLLKWNPPLDAKAWMRLTLVGGLGLLASLVCPDPVGRLRYTFNPDLAHPIMRGFVEMLPLHVHALKPPFLAGLIYIVALIVSITVVRHPCLFRMWELALLAGTALLGSYAFRSAPDFLMILLAVGIPRSVEVYRRAAPRHVPQLLWRVERSLKRMPSPPTFRFQAGWCVFLVLLLLPLGLLPRPHGKDWPESAGDFMAREGMRGNVFSDPNEGAYVVWRLGPERVRCYVDTRGFFFPPELLVDVQRILNTEDDWRERLKLVLAGDTDWFLLRTDCPLWDVLKDRVKTRYVDDRSALIAADEVRRLKD